MKIDHIYFQLKDKTIVTDEDIIKALRLNGVEVGIQYDKITDREYYETVREYAKMFPGIEKELFNFKKFFTDLCDNTRKVISTVFEYYSGELKK